MTRTKPKKPKSKYERKNLPKILLTKNNDGEHETQGLKYQYHCVKDIHYFTCEWNRRKGEECKGTLVTKQFDPSSFNIGDNIEVYLLKKHDDTC